MTPEPTKRQLTITVNDVTYRVELGDLDGSPIEVTVNGKPYLVQVSRPDTSRPAGRAPTDRQSGPAEPLPTTITPELPTTAPDTSNAIRSPMPGDIVDIQVQPGDQVQVGQHICHLEAMKMKSAIRSGRDGVIASVEVREGQPVAHGDVIVTFK